jgi:hypothetical protein
MVEVIKELGKKSRSWAQSILGRWAMEVATTAGRMLLLTRTGPGMSLSLATLEAVGRMKLDPVLRRTGAGELGTATAKCAVGFVSGTRPEREKI